jgi:integrase
MALTDTFVKNIKPNGMAVGEKHSDGHGLYLHVKESGKYWRMSYRFLSKQRTLALGVYPAVSLAKARQRRDKARQLLADGIDPMTAKRQDKLTKAAEAANTFEAVARDWLKKTAADRMASTTRKIEKWLAHDVYPYLGAVPISTIGPRDVLAALQHMEARGALESVQRVKQHIGQIFRYAIATGSAERDPTPDLKGSLTKASPKHYAAITEPKKAGELLRSIFAYSGHPYTVAALKLSPLVFVRPGELRTAEWVEMDLDAAEWRIPGKWPMSENTINGALRAMGYAQDVHSAHGFRAMARTIMDEVLGSQRPRPKAGSFRHRLFQHRRQGNTNSG